MVQFAPLIVVAGALCTLGAFAACARAPVEPVLHPPPRGIYHRLPAHFFLIKISGNSRPHVALLRGRTIDDEL